MSIVTLKKKTQAKYNNNSVHHPQFSLNGTHRSQGYVGQDTLGRSLPRTLARGNTLRGSGGCCGKYTITPSVLSAVTSTEDNTVVKSSVLSYNGMAATQYRWIRRPEPITVVKPDDNRHNTNARDYIHYLRQRTLKTIAAIPNSNTTKIICNSKCSALPVNSNGSLYRNHGATITKPETDYISQSYGNYLINKNNACITNYANCASNLNSENPTKPSLRTPLPTSDSRNP